MNLRSPFERLGGACFLPRFVDKARLFLAGDLPREYRVVFGNRRGLDGQFLQVFELSKNEFLEAVDAHPDDGSIEEWFVSSKMRVEQVERWNVLSPRLGDVGTAMEASFEKARQLYGLDEMNVVPKTVFEAICRDEGLPYPENEVEN